MIRWHTFFQFLIQLYYSTSELVASLPYVSHYLKISNKDGLFRHMLKSIQSESGTEKTTYIWVARKMVRKTERRMATLMDSQTCGQQNIQLDRQVNKIIYSWPKTYSWMTRQMDGTHTAGWPDSWTVNHTGGQSDSWKEKNTKKPQQNTAGWLDRWTEKYIGI